MTSIYSNQLRRRLLKHIEADENRRELARRFNVPVHFIYKIWRRKRETGSPDRPIQRHGPPCSVSEELKRETLGMLKRHPEMDQSDVRSYWQSKGIRLGHSRVQQLLSALGWNSATKKAQLLKVYGTSNMNQVWLLLGQPQRIPVRPRVVAARPLVPKNPANVESGRKGGKATAAKRTPEQRREASRRAAQARWGKPAVLRSRARATRIKK